MHAKTDSEVTSLAPSSPNRAVYYVQSPSRESHDGEKTSNSFHSTPILTPMGSPGHHSRNSSSSTRLSGSFKFGLLKSNRRHLEERDFDAIEEEVLLEDDDEDHGRTGRSCRCYFLTFAIGFFVLFSFFALILWGISRNQKPVVSVQSILFDRFVIQAGADASGVSTEMVTMNSTLKLIFRNKGTFFGVHVTSTPLDLSFSHLTIALGSINKFYQPRNSQRIVTATLTGRGIPLYGGGADLRSQNGEPVLPVPLTLSFTLRSRAYVLGRFVKPKFYNPIQCAVVMDPTNMNVALPLKSNCTYR